MEEATAQAPMPEPEPMDPMALTKEHLNAIGDVWKTFAKDKLEHYKGKLPDPIQRLVTRPTEAPTSTSEPAESGAV